jgi:hypothetical protein
MIFMIFPWRQRLDIGGSWVGLSGRNSAQSIQLHFIKNLAPEGLPEAVHFIAPSGDAEIPDAGRLPPHATSRAMMEMLVTLINIASEVSRYGATANAMARSSGSIRSTQLPRSPYLR